MVLLLLHVNQNELRLLIVTTYLDYLLEYTIFLNTQLICLCEKFLKKKKKETKKKENNYDDKPRRYEMILKLFFY